MAENLSDMQFSGVLKCIVKDGLLTEAEVEAHNQAAKKSNMPLISYLVNNKHLDSQVVARHIATEFGVPFFDLSAIDKSILPYNLVSERLIRQHHVLPLFQRGNHLFIALSDPTNIQALDDIKFHTRLNTETVLVEEDKLTRSIEAFIEAADTSMSDLLDADLENIIITGDNDQAIEEDTSEIDDAPIVRFVNKVFLDAIKKGASDIHLELYEKSFRIRFRNDGMLSEIASPPLNISNRIISRIKVMAKMDIAEHRVPQDGHIKMKISRNRSIDFRVSTCPTLFGEKVVLRILDPISSEMGIEELGFEPEQKDLFLNAIKKPYGMILVTGPTGSGKIVSLYTGLHILNTLERNISTAEDPVEITVDGINQVNMNVKVGLTFPVALRAFLRQDPDIIMGWGGDSRF
jgi:type IV pilus assembly protein PilB